MKHPALLLLAALAGVLAVSITAFPGRTAQASLAWNTTQPQTLQSAGVHSLVAASFHSVSAGY